MELVEWVKEKEIKHPFDMRVELSQVFRQHGEKFW